MIADISLVVIFSCFTFITMCSKVQLRWIAKAVMCIGMIAVIGNFATQKDVEPTIEILFAVFAFLTMYATFFIYKRGSYK